MAGKEGSPHNTHDQKSQFRQPTPFKTINNIDQRLRTDWAEGKEVPHTTLQGLIDYALSSSPQISNIEDRQEVRYMLRLWGSRLAREYKQKFPDIDFDHPDRSPKQLTSRPLPDHSEVGRRHGKIQPLGEPTKMPPYK